MVTRVSQGFTGGGLQGATQGSMVYMVNLSTRKTPFHMPMVADTWGTGRRQSKRRRLESQLTDQAEDHAAKEKATVAE